MCSTLQKQCISAWLPNRKIVSSLKVSSSAYPVHEKSQDTQLSHAILFERQRLPMVNNRRTQTFKATKCLHRLSSPFHRSFQLTYCLREKNTSETYVSKSLKRHRSPENNRQHKYCSRNEASQRILNAHQYNSCSTYSLRTNAFLHSFCLRSLIKQNGSRSFSSVTKLT